jgi:hypothetical protein
MSTKLMELLNMLEGSLDYSIQQKIIECHKRALNWEDTERLPLVVTYPYPPISIFYPVPHREIFTNPEKMLYNELLHAFDTSILHHTEIKDDLPYTIRANFGTVIIASILGGIVEQRDDSPPWIRHFDSKEHFMSVFEKQQRESVIVNAQRVFDTYVFYNDLLAGYPNLKKCLNIVLPDLQGPLDTLELLRGSGVYLDFIIEPELVDKGLSFIANTQIEYAKRLSPYLTSRYPGYSFQHNMLIKGNILIRNDSAIMISPEMYKNQIAGYDEHILMSMGGGGIHSCGKIESNISEIFNLPSLKCFDFGQSYLNNMDDIYQLASEKKIPLIRIRPPRKLLLSGKIKKLYPTGVSLVYDASSFEEASYVSKEYSNIYETNWNN